jgi:galactokinase
MNKVIISDIRRKFKEIESAEPLLVRSPGRINFIGEHTDYNDGFVFPAAIDKAIYFAAAKNGSSNIKLIAADLNEQIEIKTNQVVKTGIRWADYLAGTIYEIQKAGYPVEGFTSIFSGDIPQGAGLSSSAAIACGLAYTLNKLFDYKISKKELALFAQKAEHNFAGVNCGIMDQFINLYGSEDKAMKLDCRSLEYEEYEFKYPDISIILCDSGIKHALASTEYNLRRKQCEEGVRQISKKYPWVKKLRDVDISMLEEFESVLPEEIYSRCIYVVEENFRVQEAAAFLKKMDIAKFGELISLTHEGLSIDYAVSIPELDNLVYTALDLPGVIGSRMMGGGFGGCTINLVEQNLVTNFIEKVGSFYKKSTGNDISFYLCGIAPGTSLV